MKRTAPGRPPLDDDDPSTTICVKVPSKLFDELDDRARRARVTIQEIIRRTLPHEPKRYPK
jgi:hypothetical protein